MTLSEELEKAQTRDDQARARGPVTVERTKVTVLGEEAIAVLPPGADLGDLEGMLRDRGLDPDDWHVERVTVNEWQALAYGGGPDGEPRVVDLRQLKVNLRNRKLVFGQAVEVERRHRPSKTRTASRKKPVLVAVLGDQQAPYHDPVLHQVVLRWLAEVSPDELVFTGDTCDFPTISRYRDRPRWSASVQECLDAGFRVLSDYCDAAPNARRRKLPGNHDYRIDAEIMGRAERMGMVRPAQRNGAEPEHHVLSLRRLLHLDELGVELCGIEGEDWRFGEVVLAPGLVVRHEPPSEKKASRLNRSVLAGHTHRQSVRMVTTKTELDETVIRTIVETGCLCRTEEGLGYAADADWQAGFATVAIHEDGSHHFDLATWRGDALTWRGERWKAKAPRRRA